MSDFVIEDGIEIPKIEGRGMQKKAKYPFGKMLVGQSFLVVHQWKSARSSADAYGRRNGIKFSTRREGDGLRIWRIK